MSKLLVSVKNGQEVAAAIAGGCQILDIKNPERGSLGRAEAATIAEILAVVDGLAQQVEVSLALGELREWEAELPISVDWNRVQYLKAGSAGLTGLAEWKTRSQELQQRFQRAGVHSPRWIAVLYADALPVEEWSSEFFSTVIPQLPGWNFDGVLIDTWDKTGPSLGELAQRNARRFEEMWTSLFSECQKHQLLCALAGRLKASEIGQLMNRGIEPDLFAVRSAVCADQQRHAGVEGSRVRELSDLLKQQRNRPPEPGETESLLQRKRD